jgi:GH25 family lysozyme M1 (1,4-beta-N-acetylmuramidase)
MSSIKGIDISNNNGEINFSEVANDGTEYVYVKATEGTTFQDSTMDVFYNECKNNGLKVGAYHFLVGTSLPETQAANFYKKIKDYEWDLLPMMDIETNFGDLSDYIVRFINAFNQLSPLKLGIYSYTSFLTYICDIGDTIGNMPFWEANYNNDPWNLPNNFFTNRIGHQYTETGSITGIASKFDLDVFTEGVLISYATIAGTWIEDTAIEKWWYKHSDGSYTRNGWEKINDNWYYFDSDGWMLYDWKKDGDNWYYMGSDGAMKLGWVLISNKWYYFDDSNNGVMTTGWRNINDKWYFFDDTGVMQTGWIKDKGNKYFLNYSGEMISNCSKYGYTFASDGVASKLSIFSIILNFIKNLIKIK